MPKEEEGEFEDEEELFVKRVSCMHEWYIISRLYKNKYIDTNEYDMHGFTDRRKSKIGTLILLIWKMHLISQN